MIDEATCPVETMKLVSRKEKRTVAALLVICLMLTFLQQFDKSSSMGTSLKSTSLADRRQNSFGRESKVEKLFTVDLELWQNFSENACLDQTQSVMECEPLNPSCWFPFVEKVQRDNFIIISNVNWGYISFALNFWRNYKDFGYDNIVFIAEDCSAFSYLSSALGRHHVAPPILKNVNKEPQIYGSQGFGKLASMRPMYIHYFLNRGVSVIWQDLDSLPLQDPMKFVPRGFDAVLIDDKRTDFHYSSNYLCSCFIYMNPTPSTFLTLNDWIEELKLDENINQLAFNRAISTARKKKRMTIAILPRNVFPNGNDFDRFIETSAWIHANYRKGSLKKYEFLKKRGAWKINETPILDC